ncbi:Unknown protein, partial [Striga hermonthica]
GTFAAFTASVGTRWLIVTFGSATVWNIENQGSNTPSGNVSFAAFFSLILKKESLKMIS